MVSRKINLGVLTILFLITIGLGIGIKSISSSSLKVADDFGLFVLNDATIKGGSIKGRMLVGNSLTIKNGTGSDAFNGIDGGILVGRRLDSKGSGGFLDSKYILKENENTNFELISIEEYQIKNQIKDKTIIDTKDFKSYDLKSIAEARKQIIDLSKSLIKEDGLSKYRINQYTKEIVLEDSITDDKIVYYKIDNNTFNNSPSIKHELSADQTIIVNVPGDYINLASWGTMVNVRNADHIIFNFYEAKKIKQNYGSFHGVILAPYAQFESSQTDINGKVIVNDFNGPMTIKNVDFKGQLAQERVNEKKTLVTQIGWLDSTRQGQPYQIALYQNGKRYSEVINLDGQELSHIWNDLDVYDENNIEYQYEVKIITSPQSYQSIVKDNINIEHRYVNEKIDLIGKVTFDDNNMINYRPEFLKIDLYCNDQKIASQEITNDKTEYQFKQLDLRSNNNELNKYTIKTQEIKNYSLEIENYNIVYKIESNDIYVDVVWNDDTDKLRPDYIDVELLNNDKIITSKKLSSDIRLISFEQIKKIDTNNLILKVTSCQNYKQNIEKIDMTHYKVVFDLANQEPEKKDVSVYIKWEDDNNIRKVRPSKVNLYLFDDDNLISEKAVSSSSNEVIFNDIPKDKDPRLELDEVDNYQYQIEVVDNLNFNVTYKLKDNSNNIEKTTVNVEILWVDTESVKKTRPEKVNLAVYNNSEILVEKTIASNDQIVVFEDIPIFKTGDLVLTSSKCSSYEMKVEKQEYNYFKVTYQLESKKHDIPKDRNEINNIPSDDSSQFFNVPKTGSDQIINSLLILIVALSITIIYVKKQY